MAQQQKELCFALTQEDNWETFESSSARKQWLLKTERKERKKKSQRPTKMKILFSQEKLFKWTSAKKVKHSFYTQNLLYTNILSSMMPASTRSSTVTGCSILFAF